MRNLFISIFIIFPLLCFAASPTIREQDEIETVKQLIETTRKNLSGQEHLLNALIQFKKARLAFCSNPTSASLATSLVKQAMILSKELEAESLSYLFSSNFLSEVYFFNQVGEEALSHVQRPKG